MMDLQVDLKLDYKANIERYPLYQQYLRTHRPPLLAIWGENDSFFIPPGAEALSETCPTRTSNSWTPDTSLSKPTLKTSRQQF